MDVPDGVVCQCHTTPPGGVVAVVNVFGPQELVVTSITAAGVAGRAVTVTVVDAEPELQQLLVASYART